MNSQYKVKNSIAYGTTILVLVFIASMTLSGCSFSDAALKRDLLLPGEKPRAFNLRAGSKGGTYFEDWANCTGYIFQTCPSKEEVERVRKILEKRKEV